MSDIFRPGSSESLIGRLDDLRPDSEGRWGRMTAHQAVCHLNDAFKAKLGERTGEQKPLTLQRRFARFYAFTLPLPWPKGVKTSRLADAERDGTPPGAFEADVEELKDLIRRFVETKGELPPHFIWGAMSKGMWGRYAYRHTDHHLRQFGA